MSQREKAIDEAEHERMAKLIHDHVYALSQTISGREQEWAALARDNLTKRNCFDCAIEICGAACRPDSGAVRDWQRDYFKLADAIARDSTGVDDLVAKVRALRDAASRVPSGASPAVNPEAEAKIAAAWADGLAADDTPEGFDARIYETWARGYGLDMPHVRLDLAAQLNFLYNASKAKGRALVAIKLASEALSGTSRVPSESPAQEGHGNGTMNAAISALFGEVMAAVQSKEPLGKMLHLAIENVRETHHVLLRAAVREALTKLVAWYRNGLTGEGDLLEIEARHIEKWRDREYPALSSESPPAQQEQEDVL